jgi:PAS domain S-box-containing protein
MVRGEGLAEPIHPHDKSDFREKWRAALTQGASFEAEARMRRADGSYRWFLIRAVPLRDASGAILRWYGTNADIEDLKRAQEDVLKQTSRLEELFEQTPEAVAVLSADGRVLRINKEFTRIFGYEPDEVLERPIDDLIIPETLVKSAQEYKLRLTAGERVEVETVRRRKDGTDVHVSLLAVPVIAASGERVANYAIYRDITERKRSEEQLRESEARFQAMADTAPVMIWMTGTDALCNYFNKPWLEFTGRTMEQEVGTGWIQGVHPDDVQGCFDGFLPAFHAQKPFRMEYRLRRADGEYRWVLESGIPRYTGAGEFAGYIGSNIDITERKRAEEELRDAETRFRTYVDHATDALFVHGDERKVVDVNRQACESLGYTREELIGMTPRDFDPRLGMDDAFIQWMKERLEAGEVFAFETSHRRKDGTLFPVEVRVRPFWHGGHRFGLALVRDITERKRAEETLRQTQAELTHVARVATLGEMVASIAHEINQPLAAIVNNASASLRWLAANNVEEVRHSAEVIRGDAHRAAEIIQRIRSFAKKAPPQKDWIDINQTITEVIDLAHSEAQKNRVSIQTQLASDLPVTFADRIQLQQVILNLVMNAVEAMSEISVGPRQLLIRTDADASGRIVVAMRDSGPGLAPENLDRLFTPFYTTKPQGMGMGLAICRSIVEAHGGRLWATANESRGAVFQFTLPRGSEGAG